MGAEKKSQKRGDGGRAADNRRRSKQGSAANQAVGIKRQQPNLYEVKEEVFKERPKSTTAAGDLGGRRTREQPHAGSHSEE